MLSVNEINSWNWECIDEWLYRLYWHISCIILGFCYWIFFTVYFVLFIFFFVNILLFVSVAIYFLATTTDWVNNIPVLLWCNVFSHLFCVLLHHTKCYLYRNSIEFNSIRYIARLEAVYWLKWIPWFSLQIEFISHLNAAQSLITIVRDLTLYPISISNQKYIHTITISLNLRSNYFFFSRNIVCTIFYYRKNLIGSRNMCDVCCNRIFIFIAIKAITNFCFSSIIYRTTISILWL